MICPGSARFRQVCRRCAHSSRGGCGTWALGLWELPVTQPEPGPSLGEHEMSELQRSQQNFVPPLSGPANDHGLSSPCKVTCTAAALARGNSSSFPPLPALQCTVSMDVEFDSHCPVCLDTQDNTVYVMPCLLQLCCSSILVWAGIKTDCLLCTSFMAISVQADDDLSEVNSIPPAEPSVVIQGAGRPHGRPHPPSSPSLPATGCMAGAQACSGWPPPLHLGSPVLGPPSNPQAHATLADLGAGTSLQS